MPSLVFITSEGAYLVSHLFNAVHFGTIMISPTSGMITSAEGMVRGSKKTPADVAIVVPSIIQELSQSPDLLDYCARNLEFIIYCGGDLPQAVGDTIASKIRLLNQFGATELGLTANILSLDDRGNEDWKYMHFHPDLGIDLRHVRDNLHELYVVHDPLKEEQQPTITLFLTDKNTPVVTFSNATLRNPSQICGVSGQERMTLSFFSMVRRLILFPWNNISFPISQRLEQH